MPEDTSPLDRLLTLLTKVWDDADLERSPAISEDQRNEVRRFRRAEQRELIQQCEALCREVRGLAASTGVEFSGYNPILQAVEIAVAGLADWKTLTANPEKPSWELSEQRFSQPSFYYREARKQLLHLQEDITGRLKAKAKEEAPESSDAQWISATDAAILAESMNRSMVLSTITRMCDQQIAPFKSRRPPGKDRGWEIDRYSFVNYLVEKKPRGKAKEDEDDPEEIEKRKLKERERKGGRKDLR